MLKMPRKEVRILLDEGALARCPSAYVEIYFPELTGGIRARFGGYHVPPTVVYPRRPNLEHMFFAENVESLKKRIEALYPEEEYRKEYV